MLTGQHVALDDMLTGHENLVMFGRLQGLSKAAARARADELLGEFDLVDAADRRVGTYSGGMRRRDRHRLRAGGPAGGGVPRRADHRTGSAQQAGDLGVGDHFKEAGIATLLTTQYLEEADALSDRIIVIDQGTIIAAGHRRRAQGAHRRHATARSCRATPPTFLPWSRRWVRCCLPPVVPRSAPTPIGSVMPAPDGPSHAECSPDAG